MLCSNCTHTCCDTAFDLKYYTCNIIITHTDVDCGDLTDPENGAVSVSGTTYNSVATYSCDTGYVLMGDDMTTCLDTGLWSGDQPTCTGNID